ncbi:murein biosynthesis integral membrane protein MurJ [Mycolicibacterium sp. CAU 1645]|uniref:Murein biosynthesis integral membrane protein MurJ n=1 Tax=Mycolicibacterium arenosum TaxID=2952157 RepID=A0ABT1M6W9_9MYCO|nr:murein biosynthesis integral membrane protein MurJ [Mycolicibacterium sp. CAU 1645]MCP9274921.1 murein biosynthesis integral membrane protein MurJ [Mycolicibacterium sp. CAU 1645]
MTATPSERRRPQELSDAAVVSRSWGMAVATLVSRITGFVRIVLLAAILGAALSSAFSVANQLPNLIAALVLEATFTAIFVPVLARAERDDPDGGTAFVRRLVTLATALLLVATVLSVAAAPLLVHLMLGDDPQVNEPLTTAFAYLLLPQVIFYGLSSVFMAILNTRNIFGPPAWAPVVNNVVAIATLLVYLVVPGELSLDPVEMGNAKLLVLGIGTTLGVFAQSVVLLVAIRRERVSLRPLWGLDERLKKFGTMAAAMVLYVLISQVGLVVGNQIASTAAASGPAIYNYTWLVLQLPFGMIGVTVLTVVMPRLSRNAAANDVPAVLADLSLATRLTMVTLIPVVAFMTVGGPAIGSALFAYGNFGDTDAGYLGMAITLSAFTLIPYALVLLQLRVFYAREQPWTPILLIVVITAVKIVASLFAPHLTDDRELVAGYLGLANGLGFLAGATVGYLLLRNNLKPPGGKLIGLQVVRTILVTISASLVAGLVAHVIDQLLGLEELTTRFGGLGSLLRLMILGVIMVPIIVGVLWAARVPDAHAAVEAVRRRFNRRGTPAATTAKTSMAAPTAHSVTHADRPPGLVPLPYADDITRPLYLRPYLGTDGRVPPAEAAGGPTRRGRPVTDDSAGVPGSESGATTRIPVPSADDFQPDVPDEPSFPDRAPSDYTGGSRREALPFEAPHDAAHDDDPHLIPGATIAGGRYRLLVFHGGPPHLQFWHAMDIGHDRQVALTFVDPEGALPDREVSEILSRTMRLSRIDHPGIAKVLDVAQTGTGGLVVSEWIRGGSLAEVADTQPSAIGGARAIQSLAAAADEAHRSGVALSIDHPGRVRVSIDGDVALAFPATLASASPEDDIRGIGAALYALLINRWPLAESGVRSGMEAADLDPAGQPVEPRSVDRSIPFQISAAAARAVQENGGIRSAPTLLNLLQQATAVADRTEIIEPVDEPEDQPRARYRDDPPSEHPPVRRKGLLIGIAAGAVVLVIALVVLASVLKGIFSDVGGGLEEGLGLNDSDSSETSPAENTSVVKPVRATVFSPGGEADNPQDAGLAIDGNPSTGWTTDTYTDAVPFPNFKSGVGLLLQLPSPTTVGEVTFDLNSTGTSVQLRSAQSATPASLEETTELTPPQPMKTGANTITVANPTSTTYLLVWITTLGSVDGRSEAMISDITVTKAG